VDVVVLATVLEMTLVHEHAVGILTLHNIIQIRDEH